MKGAVLGGLASLALVFAFSGSATPSASAHSELRDARPAPGAKLDEAPERVDLWFSEPLDPSRGTLSVTDPSGAEVTIGAAAVDPADATHISALLRLDLPPGDYSVSWSVVSLADGHPAIGGYAFTVAGAAVTATEESPEGATEAGEPGHDTRLPVIYWSLVAAGALAMLGLGVYYIGSGGLRMPGGGVEGGLIPPGEAGHDPTQPHH